MIHHLAVMWAERLRALGYTVTIQENASDPFYLHCRSLNYNEYAFTVEEAASLEAQGPVLTHD